MATYDVSGFEIDGERIILEGGTLEATDGGQQTWKVRVEGAHMLHPQERQRVPVRIVTTNGQVFEGTASVSALGHRDHKTEVYSGTEFQGIGELHEV